jgi:predicted permease
MNWLRQIFSRRRIYDDLSEEIQQHLAEKAEMLMLGGMSREEAKQKARRDFGNVTSLQERGREAWMWLTVEGLLADAKFAIRRLRKSPGFTLTAILTLALGIGTNVIVFSVLNGLILRPLDVPEPHNVVQVVHTNLKWDAYSYRDYLDFNQRDSSFSGIVAYEFLRVGLSTGQAIVKSWGHAVSGNYFDVLGVKPLLGRFFHSTDEHGPGSAPYVVISYDLWRGQFNGDPRVTGKIVELNKHPFTVIGVAPEGFHGLETFFWPDYWIPVLNAAEVTGRDDLPYRDHFSFNVFGRLKPGVSLLQATASLTALASQMAKEDRKDDGLTARVKRPELMGGDSTKKALLGIMLLALLVLLAACTNLATIFAARAADRSGELALRLAIGSSRWHILLQLLTEALLISLAGGVLGSLIAKPMLSFLSCWQAFGEFPTHFRVTPDWRVYFTALALSLGSGILFGMLPARQVWRTEILHAIKSGTPQFVMFRRFALRDLLVVVQIAACTLLVTASLVAVRGLQLTLKVPLAFKPEHVMLAQGDLGMAGYQGQRALPVQKRLLEAVAAIPGVAAAAVADGVPLQTGGGWLVYGHGTTEFLPSHMAFSAATYLISPTYLDTVQTRLLAGRNFTWDDDGKAPNVAIVNRTFARKLFGDTSAIGQRFALWATAQYQVVGEVEDGKYLSLSEDPEPAMFLPLPQGVGGVMASNAELIVRSERPSEQIIAALHHLLPELMPSVPFHIEAWEDALAIATLPARASAIVLAVMGVLAAMLAVTGIFGMASYSVSKRMKEQGIRIALGAQRHHVVRSSVGRPVLLLLIGSTAGLGLGVLTSQILAHIVSYASPRDPLVLACVFAMMCLLGVLATLVPARRALAIDPARLLRE